MVSLIAPDRVEAIVGWRSWQLGIDGLLWSPVAPVCWKPGEALEASCAPPADPTARNYDAVHKAPCERCHCGIYAVDEERWQEKLQYYRSHRHVIGKVALWGLVIETEYGWRGQFAYPLELHLPAQPYLVDAEGTIWELSGADEAGRLSRRYGCPASVRPPGS